LSGFCSKLGLAESTLIQSTLSPVELINLPIYSEPYALRVSASNTHLDILPPFLQGRFQEDLKEKGIQLNTVDASEEPSSDHPDIYQSRQDKLVRIRKATMKFDLSEDNLMRIMKTGAKLQRFTKKKLAEKRIFLSEDEAEIVVGNKRGSYSHFSERILDHGSQCLTVEFRAVTVTDIEEIRMGQKTTTFDSHRKAAAPFEVRVGPAVGISACASFSLGPDG
jgi:hypothetical protein